MSSSFFLFYTSVGLKRFWKVVKNDYQLRHVCLSVPRRIPIKEYSWNLTFEYFSKFYLGSSSVVEIWKEYRVLYVKTRVNIWYLARFFWELEMFRKNVEKNIKIHFLFNNFFFENRTVYEIMWNSISELDRTQMTISYGACALHGE